MISFRKITLSGVKMTINEEDKIIRDSQKERILNWIYERLFKAFGPRNWWPGDTPFEIIIGAILTQNTAWANVEKAINNLKNHNLLEPEKLNEIPQDKLAELIRPAGYYQLKANRLKEFIEFLFSNYAGDLDKMFNRDMWELRAELLGVKGIGLETADSILLYAGSKPIFVVDAYTRRILTRHNLIDEKASYTQIQDLFMNNLPQDVQLYNEFHALIVQLGKEICKSKPACDSCPLKELKEIIKYVCDSCGKKLVLTDARYILKIELYAAPEVVISEEEAKKDHCAEIKRLIDQIKDMDAKKLEEEVYVKYRLHLCKKCRDTFNQRVACKEFI
ncbi:MAG: endonuclease III domain-containing protein [bacterium]